MIINNIYVYIIFPLFRNGTGTFFFPAMLEQFCGLSLGLKQKMKFMQFMHFDCYKFLM